MRHVPHVLLGLVTMMMPTLLLGAQGWQGFGIKHFGFVFDVPPGFVLTQRSDQGAAFEGKNKRFLQSGARSSVLQAFAPKSSIVWQ
ncbi:hypothetical protein LB542_06355 [Mesorhizobium sp. BR1-1-9]|uniref:hypothetical protein n=1 Tax=Mesorhizobium sp. BR1-1-9 TaxID=2876646 RepID=UPI001CD10C52|nr:hypothetical protein [Mesorhizobium sp. BR1-1-9]MBZ9870477.1 hypothetical protein [Mesorhizobium sp. BR1-1-9]